MIYHRIIGVRTSAYYLLSPREIPVLKYAAITYAYIILFPDRRRTENFGMEPRRLCSGGEEVSPSIRCTEVERYARHGWDESVFVCSFIQTGRT